MFWFSELLNEEFIDYFKSEESVYFTVTGNRRIYHKTFNKFSKAIDNLQLLLIANDADEEHYNKFKENSPDLYELSDGFFKKKTEIIILTKISEIYHSIEGNLFDCNVASLSAEQIAVALMYLFLRMSDDKDRFAESGRLREFVLTLYNKTT